MKRPWWFVVLALATFPLLYAIAFDVANRVAVYWLHQTDPKFGGAAGNIHFGHELLPVMTLWATALYAIALVPFRATLPYTTPARLIVLGALSGLGAEVIQATIDASGGAAVAGRWAGALSFVYGTAPVLITLLGGALLLRRPRASLGGAAI